MAGSERHVGAGSAGAKRGPPTAGDEPLQRTLGQIVLNHVHVDLSPTEQFTRMPTITGG